MATVAPDDGQYTAGELERSDLKDGEFYLAFLNVHFFVLSPPYPFFSYILVHNVGSCLL